MNLTADEIHAYFFRGCASLESSAANLKEIKDIIASFGESVDFLETMNDYLGGHGVESLYGGDDIIAEYINFGDTYSPTLLYNIAEAEFELTSWGDWYEEWESKRHEEIRMEYVNQSISEGTLVTDDLIEKFMAVAEEMAARLKDTAVLDAVTNLKTEIDILRREDECEALEVILEEDLVYLLDNLAPEGYYFGAHPGDGADFGFWETEEQ